VAFLQQVIITLHQRARRCDMIIRPHVLRTISVTGGLAVLSPVPTQRVRGQPMLCLEYAHPNHPHLYGSWAGFSQKAGIHRTRGGAGLAAASSGARGGTGPPPWWDGRSGPLWLVQALRPPRGPASTQGGPRPSRGGPGPW
jgi:hypothetical protein